MGPNALVKNPNAPADSGHHYHLTPMNGTPEEAANYCGNPEKEIGCPIIEWGSLPKSRQGKRSDLEDALKIIKDHAEAGGSYGDLEDSLPEIDAKYPGWIGKHYKKHFKFRDNFFDANEMWQWQKDLVSYLNNSKPDPRRILFIIDEKGNCGKSEIVLNRAFLFPGKTTFNLSPKSPNAMAFMLPQDGAEIIFVDCPRKKQYDIAYDFLEECKNGEVSSEKYESCQKSFRKPHLVVFMNRLPQTGKTILSRDRYIIKRVSLLPEEEEKLAKIDNDEILDPYLEESLAETEAILDE